MGLSDRILNIPIPVVSFLMILTIALPMVTPIGLPIKIGSMTKAGYDIILGLSEGSVVLMSYGVSPAGVTEVGTGAKALVYHVLSEGHKLILVGPAVDNPMFVEKDIPPIANMLNKQYGIDWVHLGYYAGVEMGLAAILSDISSVYTTDHRGNKLQDLPLMQEVKGAADIDLHICVTFSADMPSQLARQVAAPYGIPIILLCDGVTGTIATPYYPTQIQSIMMSMRGSAEYELLIKRPAEATGGMDSISLSYLYLTLLLVITNIATFYKRGEKKEER